MILQNVSVDLRPLVLELNDVNINHDAKNEGEWMLNESITFEYVISNSDDTSKSEDSKLNRTQPYMYPHKLSK